MTKCDDNYYEVRQVLQTETIITKCDRTNVGKLWSRGHFAGEESNGTEIFRNKISEF